MSFFPEPGRLVGHALLDAVVAYVPGGDVAVSGASANLAIGAINDIEGAVLATADDDDNVSNAFRRSRSPDRHRGHQRVAAPAARL
jgi:hypothetical protein